MSLEVCHAPGCKKITVFQFCDDHVDQGEDDEVSEHWTTHSSVALKRRPMDDDLVESVMSAARQHAAPVREEERGMTTASSDRQCTFITIRGTRCSQASMKGSTVCKPHLARQPQPSNTLPAKRSASPIALADPIVVNPPATNGSVSFAGIDRMIADTEADLAALKRVRTIVAREAQ